MCCVYFKNWLYRYMFWIIYFVITLIRRYHDTETSDLLNLFIDIYFVLSVVCENLTMPGSKRCSVKLAIKSEKFRSKTRNLDLCFTFTTKFEYVFRIVHLHSKMFYSFNTLFGANFQDFNVSATTDFRSLSLEWK